MVLAEAFEEWREKRRQEQIARAVAAAKAEVAAETRRENNAEWEAWNQRRLQAEQRGEPFAEPSPSERRRATEPPQQQ